MVSGLYHFDVHAVLHKRRDKGVVLRQHGVELGELCLVLSNSVLSVERVTLNVDHPHVVLLHMLQELCVGQLSR